QVQPIDPQLFGYLNMLQPTESQIGTFFNIPGTEVVGPIATLQLPDIDPIRESTTTTFEAGYKGILGERLLLAADVWYEQRQDLVTPLTTFTPLIIMNPQDIGAFLTERFIVDLGMPQQQAAATAAALAGGLAQV